MNIIERFLNYTKFDTQSAEDSQTVPSTPKQLDFARYLKEELEHEGLQDVEMDDKGYIYATLPANTDTDIPTIGFISHYDTSPDCSGADIKARIVEKYDGHEIVLSEGIVLSPRKFPELLAHEGEDLIVTDGHTLLGADDKAGIAEIVQAMVYLQEHPDIKHGTVRIAFNPDEEIGMGAHHFDVEKFGCQWAYTMDGGEVGELEYENFNAASCVVTIHGVNIHPGEAKNQMKNAALVAMHWNSLLPPAEIPAHTAGYEGFYHLCQMEGDEEHARLQYIIRDHDAARFQQRLDTVQANTAFINARYGEGTAVCELKESYRNMRELIEQRMDIVDRARAAFGACGVEPRIQPIRGGTDGARLSFMGLPCPNLCTGGHNYHGRFEYVCAESMEKITELLLKLV